MWRPTTKGTLLAAIFGLFCAFTTFKELHLFLACMRVHYMIVIIGKILVIVVHSIDKYKKIQKINERK